MKSIIIGLGLAALLCFAVDYAQGASKVRTTRVNEQLYVHALDIIDALREAGYQDAAEQLAKNLPLIRTQK